MTCKPTRRKTDPDHKLDRISVHIQARCSCGWSGDLHSYGRGSRSGAIRDWHLHRDKCDVALPTPQIGPSE